MYDLDVKKQGLQEMRKMVKEIIMEMASKKEGSAEAPDGSPEHEAAESPEMEAIEHLTGQEGQDENMELPCEENVACEEGQPSRSPFRSDEERRKANLYKGGDYRSTLASAEESAPANRASRRR